jgi:hypothetical protein
MNSAKRNALPAVEVALGQSIQSIKGIEWAKYTDGRPFELVLVQKPSELLLHLPGNRRFKFDVRNADLKQSNTNLRLVRVRLPVEAVEYPQAISILETEYLKVTALRDEQFANKLAGWKKEQPTTDWPQTRMARVTIESGVNLELGVETVYVQGGDKWVAFLEFYVD